MAQAHAPDSGHYYVPHSSKWPIVGSFAFFAFLLVLAWRAYEELQTDNTDEMRVAEPKDEPAPPLGY